MNKLDMLVVWALQFVVLLFFSVVVLLWYGCATLIPLALWLKLSQVITPVTGPVAATALALLVVGGFGVHLVKVSRIFDAFMETGVELIKLGHTSIQRIHEKMLPSPTAPDEAKNRQVILEDRFS